MAHLIGPQAHPISLASQLDSGGMSIHALDVVIRYSVHLASVSFHTATTLIVLFYHDFRLLSTYLAASTHCQPFNNTPSLQSALRV